MRDPAATQLEHEGARLVALLEAARTEARAAGLTASWAPQTTRDKGLKCRVKVSGFWGFRVLGCRI